MASTAAGQVGMRRPIAGRPKKMKKRRA